jgi:hypothetical protein
MTSPADRSKLQVPEGGPKPSPETNVSTDGVLAIVTQAFCPRGHDLVKGASVTFDGYEGIRLLVADGAAEDVVVLSPIHGDRRKSTSVTFRVGARLEVMCPVCRSTLDVLLPCSCGRGELMSLYLTKALSEGHVAAVCNVWGCPRSRLIDNWQVISQFVEAEEEASVDKS